MADSNVAFAANQLDYIDQLNLLVSFIEQFATELELARQGLPSLLENVAGRVRKAGLDADLSAAGFRLTNLADPLSPQDAATRAFVAAVVQMGGSPGDIPVTSLNPGTLENGALLTRSGTTLAVVGRAQRFFGN